MKTCGHLCKTHQATFAGVRGWACVRAVVRAIVRAIVRATGRRRRRHAARGPMPCSSDMMQSILSTSRPDALEFSTAIDCRSSRSQFFDGMSAASVSMELTTCLSWLLVVGDEHLEVREQQRAERLVVRGRRLGGRQRGEQKSGRPSRAAAWRREASAFASGFARALGFF